MGPRLPGVWPIESADGRVGGAEFTQNEVKEYLMVKSLENQGVDFCSKETKLT